MAHARAGQAGLDLGFNGAGIGRGQSLRVGVERGGLEGGVHAGGKGEAEQEREAGDMATWARHRVEGTLGGVVPASECAKIPQAIP